MINPRAAKNDACTRKRAGPLPDVGGVLYPGRGFRVGLSQAGYILNRFVWFACIVGQRAPMSRCSTLRIPDIERARASGLAHLKLGSDFRVVRVFRGDQGSVTTEPR